MAKIDLNANVTKAELIQALHEVGLNWDGNGTYKAVTTAKQYEQDERLALLEEDNTRKAEFNKTIMRAFLGSALALVGVIWMAASTITTLEGDLRQAQFDIAEMKNDIKANKEWQIDWSRNGELKHDTEQNLHIQNLWDSVKSIWRLHDNEGHPYAPKPEWSNKEDVE